jgi:hypothetical protein
MLIRLRQNRKLVRVARVLREVEAASAARPSRVRRLSSRTAVSRF